MGLGYKQSDLQANAQAKLDDAIILLRHKKFSNAYYLAGYAVEIGLKACIAAQIATGTIPEKSFFKKFFDHLLPGLIGLAGLASQLAEQKDKDNAFAANRAIVSEWSPEARYEARNQKAAQDLINAINDPTSGVLQWIKTYWKEAVTRWFQRLITTTIVPGSLCGFITLIRTRGSFGSCRLKAP